MSNQTISIFVSALNYLIERIRYFCALARMNRHQTGFHAAMLKQAREHATAARDLWLPLREANVALTRVPSLTH